MILYLCEKPSQAKDIGHFYGIDRSDNGFIILKDGNCVTWAIGHLLTLASPEDHDSKWANWTSSNLPICPNKYQYIPNKKTKSQLSVVGKLLKKTSQVVICTDAGREGEMIGREILTHFQFKGAIKRLWANAMDPESLKVAFNNLKDGEEFEGLYNAALVRSEVDYSVGMTLTRLVTLKTPKTERKGAVRVGRVKSPTLAMVVRRDREIENFVPQDYFDLKCALDESYNNIILKYCFRLEDRIFDQSKAEALAQQLSRIQDTPLSVKGEIKKKSPPKLFSLSGLQKWMNSKYGWAAEKSLNIAQALYEKHKVISYPRTDCCLLPEEMIPDIPVLVNNAAKALSFESFESTIRPSVWNTEKVNKHEHYALVPTKKVPQLESMSNDEKCAYTEICRHFVACLMPDNQYEQTTVSTDLNGYIFKTSGTIQKVKGWKVLFTGQDKDVRLPDIADGSIARINAIELDAKVTQPPKRYTEGTLIDDMESIAKYVGEATAKARLKSDESKGIGTPATRAAIISELKFAKMLTVKGKNILSTEVGRNTIDLLSKYVPEIIDPIETANLETILEAVKNGEQSRHNVLKMTEDRLIRYVDHVDGSIQDVSPIAAKKDVDTLKSTGLNTQYGEIYSAEGYFSLENLKGRIFSKMYGRKFTADEIKKIIDSKDGVLFEDCVSKKGSIYAGRIKLRANAKPFPKMSISFD